MNEHEYLKTSEVAKLLRVSPESVLRWISRGQLPALKRRVGRSWRYLVRREDALAALESVRACREVEVKVQLPTRPAALDLHACEVLERHGLLRYVERQG